MREMMQRLREAALQAILESEDMDSLESLRVRYLGKKGELTGILRQMGKLSVEERPQVGQLANQLRADLENAIELRRKALRQKTMPPRRLVYPGGCLYSTCSRTSVRSNCTGPCGRAWRSATR